MSISPAWNPICNVQDLSISVAYKIDAPFSFDQIHTSLPFEKALDPQAIMHRLLANNPLVLQKGSTLIFSSIKHLKCFKVHSRLSHQCNRYAFQFHK